MTKREMQREFQKLMISSETWVLEPLPSRCFLEMCLSTWNGVEEREKCQQEMMKLGTWGEVGSGKKTFLEGFFLKVGPA